MAQLANVQAQVSAAPGTGTVSLGAATAGAQGWAAGGAKDGGRYGYRIEEGQAWEVGYGTFTAQGSTLARSTINSSSNGNAAVNFGASAIVSQVLLPVDVIDPTLPVTLTGLGIGGAPVGQFTVKGSDSPALAASANAALQVVQTYTSSFGAYAELQFYVGQVAKSAKLGGMSAQYLDFGSNGAGGDLVFWSKAAANVEVTERLRITFNGTIQPGADNTQPMGSASARFSQFFAGAGTINTSDAREKTGVAPLTPAELAWSADLVREIGTFKFLAAVAQKGLAARLHVGMTVQRAMTLGRARGLDPATYSFICYDQWPARPDVPATVARAAAYDDKGALVSAAIEARPLIPGTPAGDRYGFRSDELALFLLRGLAARIDALEARKTL